MQLPVLNDAPPSKGGCSASSCGTSENQMDSLPDSIREKYRTILAIQKMPTIILPGCTLPLRRLATSSAITVTVNTIAPMNRVPAWFLKC